MKCLSLTQPWATLVALGAKKMETRSWSTKYRGPLAIHAAKRFPATAKAFAETERALDRLPSRLALGAIIAVVDLTQVQPTEFLIGRLSGLEHYYGDYSPGRFAWRLDNVRRLANPVPFKGSLGLFDIPWSAAELLQRKEE